MNAGIQAYRRKKNAQLWAMVVKLGQHLQAQKMITPTIQARLEELFSGKSARDLSQKEKTRVYRACAEDLMRARARVVFQVEHISELTADQLFRLTEDLEAMIQGKSLPAPRQRQRSGSRKMTADQERTIKAMFVAMEWEAHRQKGYIKRIIKKSWPGTRQEASHVIQAIQAVFLNGLDVETFRQQVAFCQRHRVYLDAYKRQIVADAAKKLQSSPPKLTMGLVCKVYEAIKHIQIQLQRKAARNL
jgi:hypothetical protein